MLFWNQRGQKHICRKYFLFELCFSRFWFLTIFMDFLEIGPAGSLIMTDTQLRVSGRIFRIFSTPGTKRYPRFGNCPVPSGTQLLKFPRYPTSRNSLGTRYPAVPNFSNFVGTQRYSSFEISSMPGTQRYSKFWNSLCWPLVKL